MQSWVIYFEEFALGFVCGFFIARYRALRVRDRLAPIATRGTKRNAVLCDVRRISDGATCTLERGHIGTVAGVHSYTTRAFPTPLREGCPVCGRKG